jgi:hypothetical protein
MGVYGGPHRSVLPEIPVSVNDNMSEPVDGFMLYQNYPNPFNPSTKIKFTIPTPPVSSPLVKGRTKEGFVTLKVYDVLGNEVATLVNEEESPGTYEVEFNMSSHSGLPATRQLWSGIRELPSGIYFYQLKTGTFSETKKMILLR